MNISHDEDNTYQPARKNTQEFWTELLKVQAEIVDPIKDAYNTYTKSHYLTLDNLIATVKPILNKYGFFLIQEVDVRYANTDNDNNQVILKDKVCVYTVIIQVATGEELRSQPLVLPVEQTTAQSIGATITYGRRYSLASLLGIVSDNDDDGSAKQTKKTINKVEDNEKIIINKDIPIIERKIKLAKNIKLLTECNIGELNYLLSQKEYTPYYDDIQEMINEKKNNEEFIG